MPYTQDSTLGDVLDNPAAKAILIKFVPQLDQPQIKAMLGMVRGMTLKRVSALPQAKLSEETLTQIMTELTKLK
jgi:hypothetical protein